MGMMPTIKEQFVNINEQFKMAFRFLSLVCNTSASHNKMDGSSLTVTSGIPRISTGTINRKEFPLMPNFPSSKSECNNFNCHRRICLPVSIPTPIIF